MYVVVIGEGKKAHSFYYRSHSNAVKCAQAYKEIGQNVKVTVKGPLA